MVAVSLATVWYSLQTLSPGTDLRAAGLRDDCGSLFTVGPVDQGQESESAGRNSCYRWNVLIQNTLGPAALNENPRGLVVWERQA